MAVITIFSSSYCHGEEIAEKLALNLGYEDIGKKLLEATFTHYRVPQEKLARSMHGPGFFFNEYTHAREKKIAYIKATLARFIQKDNFVYHGFAGHLLPKQIPHILRVALVATRDYRTTRAMEKERTTEKDALRILQKSDDQQRQWSQYLFKSSPWDKALYDIMIPMHTTSVEEAIQLIYENVHKPPLATTPKSREMTDDFIVATEVNIALIEKGHDVDVICENGQATIVINKYVMRLEHHKNELEKIAAKVPGVNDIKIQISPDFKQPSIYPGLDNFDIPSKILLVDDEKDFVHTLSERLQTRQMGSEVAYNGEQALAVVEEEEPEVMILDLKMPGIDGIEVLRRVKKDHPDVEVIVLTGHGSEREERLAQELGAFAYLQKPVNINILTQTMKEAYKKISDS